MRVIAKRMLREFWQSRKTETEKAIAARDLLEWYQLASDNEWANFGQLRQTFGSVDVVGHCTVFNVGNNRYRLIGRVNYRTGIIYTLKVRDHAEYDKATWADECGCHQPPPPRPRSAPKGTAPHPKQTRRP
jgi:mRNA interferase HigB